MATGHRLCCKEFLCSTLCPVVTCPYLCTSECGQTASGIFKIRVAPARRRSGFRSPNSPKPASLSTRSRLRSACRSCLPPSILHNYVRIRLTSTTCGLCCGVPLFNKSVEQHERTHRAQEELTLSKSKGREGSSGASASAAPALPPSRAAEAELFSPSPRPGRGDGQPGRREARR